MNFKTSKKELMLLILTLLISGVILAGFWMLFAKNVLENPVNTRLDIKQEKHQGSFPKKPENLSALERRISLGEKILVAKENSSTENPEFTDAKQKGVAAIAAGKYEEAAIHFKDALKEYPNAPETLIYQNNASIGAEKAYSIAVVAPIDTEPNIALEILRGVAQAQNEINKIGGINGVPMKVAIADDDDRPEIAEKIASALVEMPEILGVIGHYSSDTSLAARSIYDSKKLVAISATSTSTKFSDVSPWVFRTVPSDDVAAQELAHYVGKQLKRQKAAVFYNSQSAYSKSLRTEFVKAIFAGGGQDVAEFDLSKRGFSAFKSVEEAIAKGAEVLMLVSTQDTLDKTLQVVAVNSKRLSLLGGDDMYAPKTLEVGREAVVGMVVAVAWHIDGDPNSEFARKSRQLWNADVNWRTAMAYDAMQAFIAALKRNLKPTRINVQIELSAPDFSATAASDTIRFLPSGDRKAPVQLVEIRPAYPSRSGTGYDFVPLPRSAPAP